jgi:hypothetical protein
MLTGLIQKLAADLDPALGVGADVYEDVLPRNYTFPAVAVHQYGGDQDSDTGGPVNNEGFQFQFDIYGKTQAEARAVRDAIQGMLVGFVGSLPDGTKIQGAFYERKLDLPFLANADTKAVGFRKVLGLRFVAQV